MSIFLERYLDTLGFKSDISMIIICRSGLGSDLPGIPIRNIF